MAQLTHAQSRRLYSWWWDSHISPKNSKWLQDNLADIDGKVRAMIKLIEEDAESFAQRAEMFYKNRPELMKLVEEFYRAYRALAERYDHATGALRQAHRKMAEAFPNEIPLEFPDEAPSELSANDEGSQDPNIGVKLFDPDSLQHDFTFLALPYDATVVGNAEKTDGPICKTCLMQLKEIGNGPKFNEGKVANGSNTHEDKKYSEYNLLQKEISRLSKEKQDLNNQIGLESVRAEKSEYEVQHLKDAFAKVKSDKEAALSLYQESLSRVSYLEHEISHTQEEIKKLNEEMLAGVKCLNSVEEPSVALQKTNQSLNLEMDKLKQNIKEQKEEILRLEKANHSMNLELEALKKRIREQKEELNLKSEELEKLKDCLKEEQQGKTQAEMTCHSIEKQLAEWQLKEKLLATKIQSDHEVMEKLMLSKANLEEKLQKATQGSAILNEQKLSSALKVIGLQNEILSLTDSKVRLENELNHHVKGKTSLQCELSRLKEDRNESEERYNALREEIQAVNCNVQSILSMIKDLQNGSLELKENINKHEDEKDNLESLKRIGEQTENNAIHGISCAGGNEELEKLRAKIWTLEESCYNLHGRISNHHPEKTGLVSQCESVSWEMEKLSMKNIFLENSLSDMNIEFDALRGKIKSLEQSCQSLHDEKFNILSENFTLILEVEHISQNLEMLERSYAELESKHSVLELEKYSVLQQLADLQELLRLEKEEHNTLLQSSKCQLNTLSDRILLLQEEDRRRKEELELEPMKIINAQIEIFILKRCLCDLKEENLSLFVGSQKHQEMLSYREKVISELEQECLIQDKKIKSLTGDSRKLKEWIHRIMKLLKTDLEHAPLDAIDDEILLQLIVRDVGHLLQGLSEAQDEKQLLFLEKSLVITLLEQFGAYVADLRAEKTSLVKETAKITEEFAKLKNVNYDLLNENKQLRMEIQAGNQKEETLKVEVDIFFRQLSKLQEAHSLLQLEISKMFEEKHFMSKTLRHLKHKQDKLEEENSIVLAETVASDCLFIVLKNCMVERECKLELLNCETNYLSEAINDLDKENRLIIEKIAMLEPKNDQIKELVSKSKRKSKCLPAILDERQKQHNNTKADLLLNDIQFTSYNAKLFKVKVNQLITSFQSFERNAMVQRNSLQQEIMKRDLALNKLKEKLFVLEGENQGLMADLNTFLLSLRSLSDDFMILEEHTISLVTRCFTPNNHNKEAVDVKFSVKTSKEAIECYAAVASPGLLNLQTLHAKLKELQKVVIDTGSLLQLERLDSNASLEAALRAIEGLTPRRSQNKQRKKPNNQQNSKDVRLDVASDSSLYGDMVHAHELGRTGNIDVVPGHATELCEPTSAISSNIKQKGQWVAKEKDVAPYQIENLEGSGDPSLELVAEKELGVDRLVLSKSLEENKDWNIAIMERLTSDCKRLLNLQANVIEIQKNIESFEKMNIPKVVELHQIKLQLKDIEETISKLIDINSRLAKKVEAFSMCSDNQVKEKKNICRRSQQISDRAMKLSEKIGKLEMEIQKIRHTLSKFEEEHAVNRTKVVKRSGILLKEYIYGKRDSRRQKKGGSSCNCIRPKSKGD